MIEYEVPILDDGDSPLWQINLLHTDECVFRYEVCRNEELVGISDLHLIGCVTWLKAVDLFEGDNKYASMCLL